MLRRYRRGIGHADCKIFRYRSRCRDTAKQILISTSFMWPMVTFVRRKTKSAIHDGSMEAANATKWEWCDIGEMSNHAICPWSFLLWMDSESPPASESPYQNWNCFHAKYDRKYNNRISDRKLLVERGMNPDQNQSPTKKTSQGTANIFSA